MQSSLHTHVTYLQDTLLQLTESLTQPHSAADRGDIQERIAIVNMAIDHYRRAYQFESQIRNPASEIVQATSAMRRAAGNGECRTRSL